MSKVFNMVGGGGGVTASIFVNGLSQTDTVTATNGSKTRTGKWIQEPNPAYVVPDGYTQLEYIESSARGTCIKTGMFASSNGFRFKGAIYFTQYDSTKYQFACGQQPIGGSPLNAVGFGAHRGTTNWTLVFDGNINAGGTIQANQKYDIDCKLFSGDISFEVNGSTLYTSTKTATIDTGTEIFVFGINNGGSIASENFCGRFYPFELYNGNNALTRSFIPCKRNSDGVIGMYDIVTNAFFENEGTGTFTAGAEIPQTIDGFMIKPIRDLGTWTVTATDGVHTKTQDVLVDVITEYEIEMSLTA